MANQVRKCKRCGGKGVIERWESTPGGHRIRVADDCPLCVAVQDGPSVGEESGRGEDYRVGVDCLGCGRARVQANGICEKCGFNNDLRAAAEWHKVVMTTCTILGLSPALSAQESLDAMVSKIRGMETPKCTDGIMSPLSDLAESNRSDAPESGDGMEGGEPRQTGDPANDDTAEIYCQIRDKFRTDSFGPEDWIYETLAVIESRSAASNVAIPPRPTRAALRQEESVVSGPMWSARAVTEHFTLLENMIQELRKERYGKQ